MNASILEHRAQLEKEGFQFIEHSTDECRAVSPEEE